MEQMLDAKLIEKLRKVLNLARDGGATEGEANSAMEMAQKIARANNIDIASIELQGGNAGEEHARAKDEAKGEGKRSWAQYPWQQELMRTIGEVNFCYVEVKWGVNKWSSSASGKYRPIGYTIIGRKSNVATAKEMFTYLVTTINRLLLAHNGGDAKQNMSRYSNSWKEGCADRLRERLQERHEAALAEQQREAKEQEARARHPAAATGNALVVVLTDFAQREEWLNNDYRTGMPPGTTEARLRAEKAAEASRAQAEAERIAAAKAAGATDREIAAVRQYGFDLEQARLFIERIDNPAPDARSGAQRRKEAEKERRDYARWAKQEQRREAKAASRLDYRGYRAGQSAGDSIGLDKQVPHKPSGRIV